MDQLTNITKAGDSLLAHPSSSSPARLLSHSLSALALVSQHGYCTPTPPKPWSWGNRGLILRFYDFRIWQKADLKSLKSFLVPLFLQDPPLSETPGNYEGSAIKTKSRKKHFWNGGIKTSENMFFHKSNKNTDENCQNQVFQNSRN